ncbi:hypothetical protein [Nocardioides euryhalodurans]|uniref:Uncharacterized protein n=1 Tax=Nocardioides euryhalodurans TaxID=2518370 RepID=A0A4V1BEB5_9ACTN|nr:hypothetical protein [Nocardioides euryhalodurans]QBR94042.1 hypothetical protein EXE57_18450 [Nocardioides euryhalodurans]
MSKMDDLRALREARYERHVARGAQPAPPRRPVQPQAAEPERPTAATTDSSADELCGHRNMSGRTCTREKGHAAKSHRYS